MSTNPILIAHGNITVRSSITCVLKRTLILDGPDHLNIMWDDRRDGLMIWIPGLKLEVTCCHARCWGLCVSHETHGNEKRKFSAKSLLRDWNQSTYSPRDCTKKKEILQIPFLPCAPFFLVEFSTPGSEAGLNLVTLESAQHLISPYSIIPESHSKVMRIKEMITNMKILTVKQILLVST